MFTVGNLDALLYCFQQLGVMVSVGAETVILIAYMLATKDGVVDETEARFSRAIRRALGTGIITIVISGVIITLLHGSLGEGSIIFEPAFLFKWLLILMLASAYFLQWRRPFLHFAAEGAIGATWYALFLVHILAPMTTWIVLLLLYIFFLGLFEGGWISFVVIRNRTEHSQQFALAGAAPMSATVQIKQVYTPAPAPKPLASPPKPVSLPETPPPPPPPELPKPTAPPSPPPVVIIPVVVPRIPPPPPPALAVLPGPPMKESQKNPLPISMPETFTPKVPEPPAAPPAPTPALDHDPHSSPWLPAIHVMPKSQEELDAKTHVTPFASSKHA